MSLHDPIDQSIPTACGCDNAPGLLPVETALARALALVPHVPEREELPLAAASGRVLACDLLAPVPLPLFDNAAMDGYALRLQDLEGAGPWHLPVTGRVRAGDAPGALLPGCAMRILTGAPLPSGADAVVAQEQVVRRGGAICLAEPPCPDQHIRRRGDDLAQDTPLLAAGCLLGPRALAALAGAGFGAVPVRRALRVAVLCSGSELVAPGLSLAPGQIWDANQTMLAAALDRPWITRIHLPACADDPFALRDALGAAAAQADIVITTGGVSVGDEDHMPRVIGELGGRIEVMKLAMKPGKPLSVGQVGSALWLGLPGNPVAAFVTWHVIGQVLAARMAGMADTGPRRTLAALAAPLWHRAGRCEYRPAILQGHDARGVLQVACPDLAGSHRIARFARADALVRIPAELEYLAQGDLIEVLPL